MIVEAAPKLKAPFPAFGGKSRVADVVWSRFGDVRNYVEPFCFSAAMLLNRPGGAGPVETINDLNVFVPNFWRAVAADPEAVARYADWPVSEADLHARHRWLLFSDQATAKLERVRREPDAYDAKIAGWWCWGACCWIGSGWCDERGVGWQQIPHLSVAGRLNLSPETQPRRPVLGHRGHGVTVEHKRPILSAGNTTATDAKRPHITGAFSRGDGVNGNDAASVCDDRRTWLTDWMVRLANRLRPVRVCCGHWDRVCDSDSTMTRLGLTGVFLDPPYRKTLASGKRNRTGHIYANDKTQCVDSLCDEVQTWCLKWGTVPDVRIALCGLEGEYPAIEAAGWTVHAWKSTGGYGNLSGASNENAARERIWFSPNCLSGAPRDTQTELFGAENA